MELLDKVASELREPGRGGDDGVSFIQQMFHRCGAVCDRSCIPGGLYSCVVALKDPDLIG